jgi:DNA anti-recombination protein RmuC
MTTKEEFTANLRRQFDEWNYKWNIERNKLEAKAQIAEAHVKKEIREQIEGIRQGRNQVKGKLEEMEISTGHAWDDVKEGAEKSWKELIEAFKTATSRFK